MAGSGTPLVGDRWAVPVWLIVPIAGFVTALVRRDRPFTRGSVAVAGSLVAVLVSGAMIRGDFHDHLAVIHRPIAAVAMAVGLASLIRHVGWVDEPTALVRRVAPTAAVVAVVALGAVIAGRQIVGDDLIESRPALIELADDVAEQLPPGTTVVFQAPGSPGNWDVRTSGLMLQLELDGFDVRQLDAPPRTIGQHRVTHDPGDGINLMVVEGDLRDLPDRGWTVIASGGEQGSLRVLRLDGRDQG